MKIIWLAVFLLTAVSTAGQQPVVFHSVNCVVTQSLDVCVGCTGTFVPQNIYSCQVYLTGGSGNLWPMQANPATMTSLEGPIVDGTLPSGYLVDPNAGLVIRPNPVGYYLGPMPVGCSQNMVTGAIVCTPTTVLPPPTNLQPKIS